MNQTGFPVQFPAAPQMPQARMAQPAWAPARRAQQPMMAVRMSRPVSSTMGGHQVGQSAAQLWARGSDITFSILTGVAAVVSGVALIMNFGKGQVGTPTRTIPGAPGQPMQVVPGQAAQQGKQLWYFVGGAISLIGLANIWSSINRAAALQPQAAASASTGQ
jgi:hypothetical protein